MAHSTVQLAFEPDPKPHHCGYCNSNGSCSVGIIASTMLVDDYQILMDRGWRKCGSYYYKSLMKKTCCPLYTIRCDANKLQLTTSQLRVIQVMNQYINDDLKPGNRSTLTHSTITSSATSKSNKVNDSRSTSVKIQTTAPSDLRNMFDAGQWLNDGRSTNARRLLRHIIENDTPPSDELVAQLRARQKRWYKKLMKLKEKNQLSGKTEIRHLIKRYDRMEESCDRYNLEELLKFRETRKNQFELRLVRSYPPSEEFKRTMKMSHEVYQRYQMAIHGDTRSECSFSQFERFLCQSSLKEQSPRLTSVQYPTCGYGSFHLQYYLNEKLIACSVIDILPGGVSSVYFYYEPDLGFLKLGVYSALRELELTRKLAREIPEIKNYYLGFYVHSCVKMRYKGQYKPSFLLCPETYTWHSIEQCRPLLDANKYARFESDPNKVDEEQENNIENLKLRIQRQIMSPTELRRLNEDYFFYILERFSVFANFVGRICANRIIIALN